ncbi:MAG: GAF domain-containing protein [Fusobacteriaceae bacterium]|jgi:GAF domain-containing protein|nr:GAF domain-containing protein [Fusobacteriaceae bacterium]
MNVPDYELTLRQAAALADDSLPFWSNLANISALIMEAFDGLNWAGFYLMSGGILVLGPFQGKPACTKIPLDKGVCGYAASAGKTVNVPDVHEFPGHIACDCASQSEIVVPLISGDTLYGVLDIDAPVKDRFSPGDQEFFEHLVNQVIMPFLKREEVKA